RHTRCYRDWSSDVCSSDLLLRVLEKFLYRRAERIIMIWPRTEEYVARLGISPKKVVWIPHLADPSRYEGLKTYDGTIGERFTVKIGRASCRGRVRSGGGGG